MYRIKHDLLFCPGPVNVSSNIWRAISNSIGHRENEFSDLLVGINDKLLKVYEIKNKDKYHSVIITGSGTAANEAVLSSLADKNILVLTNGEFGERLYNIAKLHIKNTIGLSHEWGEVINLKKVEVILNKRKIDIIAMTHHETSTGILNPVKEIGRLAQTYKTKLFVDTVSSSPLEKIDLEKWNITFCTTSSGKTISSLPGLGIIMGEIKSFEELKNVRKKTAYLDLYNLYHFSKNIKQTPNTPAVHLFYAIDQALTNILTVGIEKWRQTIRERAIVLRAGMRKLGLQFLYDESRMSSVLTTIVAPRYISVSKLKQKLKEKRIIIYNGKGPLINKVFQVGNIGELSKNDVNYFLHSLKDVLFADYTLTQKEIF
jgi:2-aminoethylphosphonate-pyruvate transaminase